METIDPREFFSHSKSLETINPRGVAKFDPGDMIGIIYEGPLAIATYKISKLWALWFQRRRFFNFFPIVSLWRLSTPRAWPNLTPGA